MGRLVVTEFVTLDGVAQGPGGPDEDPEGGFVHGGWQAPLIDHDTGAALWEQSKGMDVLVLGRRTYDIFADYWPTAPEEIPWTSLLRGIPKYVASRTLREPLGWAGASLIGGDLAAGVDTLKQEHGHVHVIGSLGLVQSLLRLELVDRLNLWVHPVVLGSGKRVFGEGAVPTALNLADSAIYPSGVVHLGYDRAGKPGYGDMTKN